MKKRRLRKEVLYVILGFFLILFVISIGGIGKWFLDHRQYLDVQAEIEKYVNIEFEETPLPEITVDFERFNSINEDTVAYVYVRGTSISYPVVQTTDNKYYLNHSFNKKKNNAGWVFMDYHNKLDGSDKNIVLYGHNRIDGIMFGTLKNTLNSDWYLDKSNSIVQLIVGDTIYKYEVFSVYKIKAEDYYIQTEFSDGFAKFVDILRSRSVYDFGVRAKEDDQILTLSTCMGFSDTRLVLHAKLIKDA